MKRERYKMMKKLFCGIVISCLCFTGQIFAAKTLQMVEVITSPKRTEVVKERIMEFEAANPGVKVELTSLPWGQAFEKLATMVMAGEAPDVVEMPDTWTAQYVANKMLVDLQPYLDTWSESKELSKKNDEYGDSGG
jgi:multiple sugar transport system substrate-binding protein